MVETSLKMKLLTQFWDSETPHMHPQGLAEGPSGIKSQMVAFLEFPRTKFRE